MKNTATIDREEIAHFAKDSAHWWDEQGPFKPLHRLNPVRMSYIKAQICTHFDRDMDAFDALSGLDILDIGCGGGLVCEPLARMGATATGIDADDNAIAVARHHAAQSDLDIAYICDDAGHIDDTFDVVLALEIVEHVADIPAFIQVCVDRLKPGGLLIMSTLNRTAKSYALGIIAAEYILGWVPRGTHHWKKFVKPSELAAHVRGYGFSPSDVTGLIFNPLQNDFTLSDTDLDVNYLMTFKQLGASP